ncbi:DUF257 family protein [Thermococcus sp.]
MRRAFEAVTRIMDSLEMGETVLLIYDESLIPEFSFLFFVEYASQKGVPVIVDDILDSLYVIKQHLEFIGVDTTFFENITVIKVGGTNRVGNVRQHIPLEGAYREKYRLAVREVYKEQKNAINLVLGIENLFYLLTKPSDVMETISELISFLGEKSRIAIFMISRDITEKAPVNPLPFFERIASTIIYTESHPRKAVLRIRKCSSLDLVGKSLIVELDDLFQYWRQ